MRRIFFLLLVGLVLTTASVAGCEKNQIGTCVTVKAYGLIGWNSVGEVSLTTDKSGNVIDMTIEEYYLPSELFVAGNYRSETFASDQVETVIVADGSKKEYIKNVGIGKEEFTLFTAYYKSEDGDNFNPPRYTVNYRSKKKSSLNTFISTDEGGEYYVKMLRKGEITVGIVSNGKYQMVAQANYLGGINKSCTGYWSSDLGERKGWALNIQLFKTKMIEIFNKKEVNKPNKAEIEKMKIDSGATFSSFADYTELAYKAYKKLTGK